jgi:hypothetical protein
MQDQQQLLRAANQDWQKKKVIKQTSDDGTMSFFW